MIEQIGKGFGTAFGCLAALELFLFLHGSNVKIILSAITGD